MAELNSGDKDEPEEYIVEAIRGKQVFDGKVYYQLKWQGWPESSNTWEPPENCTNCENLIREYEESLKKQKRNESSASRAEPPDSSDSSEPQIIETRRRRVKKKRGPVVRKSVASSSTPKVKRTRVEREREAIQQILGPSNSANTSGTTRRSVSTRGASPSVNANSILSGDSSNQNDSGSAMLVEPSLNDDEDDVGSPPPSPSAKENRFRILSSSEEEEDDDDENNYFGWERGKTIVEIIQWFGYKDKILHLVKYSDGEVEYVDDDYTCRHYKNMVLQLYQKNSSEELTEDHKTWFMYAIQRFCEIEAECSYERESRENESPVIVDSENDDEGPIDRKEADNPLS